MFNIHEKTGSKFLSSSSFLFLSFKKQKNVLTEIVLGQYNLFLCKYNGRQTGKKPLDLKSFCKI